MLKYAEEARRKSKGATVYKMNIAIRGKAQELVNTMLKSIES
jgi:hypothetical protein